MKRFAFQGEYLQIGFSDQSRKFFRLTPALTVQVLACVCENQALSLSFAYIRVPSRFISVFLCVALSILVGSTEFLF
jgi:hypothetical protein